MPSFDIDQLLTPVSEESPSGANLEYDDPRFGALERASAGEPERYSGKEVIPAKDPNWKEVRRLALELLPKSKDLRVAVQLTQAETALEGIAGLAAAVSVIKGLAERFWTDFYPQLETDDGEDPLIGRSSALAPLTDLNGLIGVLRKTPLVEAKSVGRFSFRDLDIAENRIPAPEAGGPSLQLLLGALNEAGVDYARERIEFLRQVTADLQAVAAVFTEHGGPPDFTPLQKAVQYGIDFFAKGLPAEEAVSSSAVGSAPGAVTQSTGEIRSREDVKRILGQICEFLQRTEPSNPAPILLSRARALLDRGFLDIIQDLAPEALPGIEKLAGTAQTQAQVTAGS
jgi:type VI secretion system protein ImpA